MEVTVKLTPEQVKMLLLVLERGMTLHPADANIIAHHLRRALPDFDPCDSDLSPFSNGRR